MDQQSIKPIQSKPHSAGPSESPDDLIELSLRMRAVRGDMKAASLLRKKDRSQETTPIELGPLEPRSARLKRRKLNGHIAKDIQVLSKEVEVHFGRSIGSSQWIGTFNSAWLSISFAKL